MTTDITDLHGEATHRALDEAWSSWGVSDEHVIAPLVNPAFLGGPAWPGLRQAHRVVRGPGLLVASDGLADPAEWDDAEPTNGFGLEVYGISGDLPLHTDLTAVSAAWLGRLVMAVSQQVAGFGFQVPDMLDHYATATLALPDPGIPEEERARFVDDEDWAVVMLNLTAPELPARIAGPLSSIRLVNVKLLTVAEANYCIQGDQGQEEARAELGRRFAAQGGALWSSVRRESVV